ncbi:reverse transcriptase [Plakobranchus ocellatus]|uniref:Reverse transcriptase n=1 Tax=Plakobranchus ocellatus TaxID=259542 RepID=A0AAV4C766_9GAST|nr:reverse transcriptase [Plakobranchus ocellatus]
MKVILRSAERVVSPEDLGGGCYMPPVKNFIDDTTIMCSKENETCRLRDRSGSLMNWRIMSFETKNSRSLFIRKYRSTVVREPAHSAVLLESLSTQYHLLLCLNRHSRHIIILLFYLIDIDSTPSSALPESIPTSTPSEVLPESIPTLTPSVVVSESTPSSTPSEVLPELIPTLTPSAVVPESILTSTPSEVLPESVSTLHHNVV